MTEQKPNKIIRRILITIIFLLAGTLAGLKILPSNDAIICSSVWFIGAILIFIEI